MWTWILEIIGFLALGTAVVVGAVAFGLPYLITKWLRHDQATCDCWDCKGRRHRAVEKAKKRMGGQIPPHMQGRPGSRAIPEGDVDNSPNHYWATNELHEGLRVLVKGTTYRVTAVHLQTDGNTRVELLNVLTNKHTLIMITQNMRKVKMWRKLELY